MCPRATVDVCCLEPADGSVGRRLADRADRFSVDRVAVGEGVRPDRDPDCFVAVGVGASEELATVDTGVTPVVAVVDPGGDDAERALAAGATDVVTTASEDVVVLANRIDRAVDHRRTADDLHEAERRFEGLLQNADFAVLTIDRDSVVRYASPAVEDIFGYAPEAVVGESLTKLMPESFRSRHREGIEQYVETGERALDWGRIELPGRHADGTEVPLRLSFSEETVGGRRRFNAIVEEITDERARQERLDRLDSAIEGSMDGIALLDEDGRYRYVNDAHCSIYGYDGPDALLGCSWERHYDEGEIERFHEEIMPTVHAEGQWRGEATGLTADGERFPQELTLTEIDDGGLICVVRDVSDRVDQRRRLREERQFAETVIDTLPDVFYVVGTDGTFDRWNDRFEEITGYTEAELCEMRASDVIAPGERETVSKGITHVLDTGETETIRAPLLTKQGDRIPYEFSGSRLTDADGNVVGLAGIGRDVSDRELRRQRLSVLSRVLRHNVRNRTTVIQGQTEHVRERVDDPSLDAPLSRVEAAAAELAAASDRARQAEQILREGSRRRRPIDLSHLAENAVESVATDGVDVRSELPDSACVVGTPTIEDAVAELLANVRSHVEEPTVRLGVEPTAEDRLALVVADDGPGIPPHERRALAEGDESPLSHSTGLGLWLVRWIVTVAGGQVSVRDSELGGSAVVLSFQRAQETTR